MIDNSLTKLFELRDSLTKVKQINNYSIEFENGVKLFSNHDQDCCEHHWLDFEHLSI